VNPSRSQSLHRAILSLAVTLLTFPIFAQTKTAPTAIPCKSTDLSSRPKSAQSDDAAERPAVPPCPAKHHVETSISLGVFSQFTSGRTQDLYNGFSAQGTVPSAGTLGTFRQTFSPWLGYSVNLGYSRVAEHYPGAGANINSNMYESSIAYVAHTPVNKRFSLFGDAGPGLLTFLPFPGSPHTIQSVASVQVRPVGVFGSGVDVHLGRQFDLRAEYRGLLYSNPDFRTGDSLSKLITVSSEPTLSLVYHFHPQPLFPAHR
jgi:hypothetical protein